MLKITAIIFCAILSECLAVYICNKTALSHVDVRTSNSPYERSTVKNGVILTMMENKRIEVISANVPDLCEEIIMDMPKLEHLSLVNVNMTGIQVNAFKRVPKLARLYLSVNGLTTIKKGSFNNLPELKVLYLSMNQISHIEEDAFKDMLKLESVHLDRNQLKDINGNLFTGCYKIKLIDFSFNHLEEIKADSFKDITPRDDQKYLTIKLSKNNIKDFNYESLKNINNPLVLNLDHNFMDMSTLRDLFRQLKPRSKLFLNWNNFICIPDDVVESMRNTSISLYMNKNPFDCNCLNRIDRILEEENYGNGVFEYSSKLACELAFSGPIQFN